MSKDKSHEDYSRIPFLSMEKRGSYFSDALQSFEENTISQLVFSTLLANKMLQSQMGIIVTKVKGDILQNLLNQYMLHSRKEALSGPFSDIYAVNRNRIKIADTTKSVILNQALNSEVVEEVLVSKKPFSGIYKNYRGVQVLGTALFVPEANWVIIAENYVKEAFALLAQIKHIFLLSGTGAFFLVLLFGFVISGKIDTIIKKMIEGTKKVADGNLDHVITIGKRNDETGNLVDSFNVMTKKLRVYRKEKEYKPNALHICFFINHLGRLFSLGPKSKHFYNFKYYLYVRFSNMI